MTNSTVPFEALKKGMWIVAIESINKDVIGGWVGKITDVNHTDETLMLTDSLEEEEDDLFNSEHMTYIVLQDAPLPDVVVPYTNYTRLKNAHDAANRSSEADARRTSVESAWFAEYRAAVKALIEKGEILS